MTAITAVEYVNLRKFLNQIALLFFYWNCIPANIRLDEDVFRLRLQKTSSRRLQDVLIKTNMFALALRLQKTSWSRPIYSSWPYVFKTSSRHLQDVFKTSRLQDIFKTSCKDIFKTFPRRTTRLNCLPRSHLWEIYGQCRKFVSVLKFIKFYHNSMVLVFHFTGT